jgi:hypothetical protein
MPPNPPWLTAVKFPYTFLTISPVTPAISSTFRTTTFSTPSVVIGPIYWAGGLSLVVRPLVHHCGYAQAVATGWGTPWAQHGEVQNPFELPTRLGEDQDEDPSAVDSPTETGLAAWGWGCLLSFVLWNPGGRGVLQPWFLMSVFYWLELFLSTK